VLAARAELRFMDTSDLGDVSDMAAVFVVSDANRAHRVP
jgi:hypothetical protein